MGEETLRHKVVGLQSTLDVPLRSPEECRDGGIGFQTDEVQVSRGSAFFN